MARRPEGLARLSDKLVLGVCVAISLWLLTLDDPSRLRIASRWAHHITTPIEVASDQLAAWRTLRSENERLRTRIAALELDAHQILLERERFEELRDRAGFHERARGHLLPARVIELQVGRFPLQAKIRCPSADSLRVFQPVVTEKGLVGRIFEVLDHDLALVQLLTDLESRISVRAARSGVVGLLRYDGQRFLMDQVPRGEPVQEGDVIQTSGLGGTVPEGLPVGEIIEIRSSASELFQRIELRPFVRFSALDDVYVVERPGPWYVRPADADEAEPVEGDGEGPDPQARR